MPWAQLQKDRKFLGKMYANTFFLLLCPVHISLHAYIRTRYFLWFSHGSLSRVVQAQRLARQAAVARRQESREWHSCAKNRSLSVLRHYGEGMTELALPPPFVGVC